ncbi:hypothetical protein GGD40_005109 [Paraburkholderia bryophila]|uniref:Uncharacterized protein n=1 Tax=Paraburkholderia bryophila TaxID=420952 RepID=A0A7Y9WTB3_9BURK|nr:hypothetical protein [Paraburkholderia bryophila]
MSALFLPPGRWLGFGVAAVSVAAVSGQNLIVDGGLVKG